MSKTKTKTGRSHAVPLATILQRTAMPFFLFTVVLTLLLLISRAMLLPRFTQIDVAGSVRDAQGLQEYHRQLKQQIADKQLQRDHLVLPAENSAYRDLVVAKQETFDLNTLRASLEQVASEMAEENGATVYIQTLRYAPGQRQAELIGDVRNVGPRSMTVLAQFLEVVRDMPFVADVNSPKFSRMEHPDYGFYSPFRISIKLL